MASVSLDGLSVEVSHTSTPAQVAEQLQAFATDLARNKFKDWGVTIRDDEGQLVLEGNRGATHFTARVEPSDSLAVVLLSGQIDINRMTLTLAGGEAGLKKRVCNSIRDTLQTHLHG